MNTSNILSLAGQFVTGLEKIEENIYRGTLNVSDKVAGVYYFDLNNKPLEDFEMYQEDLLANEFYANPGDLQWNYYLFLLNDKLGHNTKEQIEKNDKYARKYVLTEEEFKDFFTFEKSDAFIKPNIVELWKERLDKVGLNDVYSTKSYVEFIAEFNSSDLKRRVRTTKSTKENNPDKISFINRLKLQNNYRRFPEKRTYDFGKVNLFRGINGVGKTSLFEAIELMICGKSLRNPADLVAQKSIVAEFNFSRNTIEFDSRSNNLYQSRNLNWYGINNRTNNLYISFNRFNFFNADAAHNFSNAKNETEARDALFSIVLGPEYKYISDRCKGTLERLRPEYNKLEEQIELAKGKETSSSKIINNHKDTFSIAQLRHSVIDTYQKIQFREASEKDELVIIESRNNSLQAILNSLNSTDNSLITFSKFSDAFSNLMEKRVSLESKTNDLRTITERLNNKNLEKDRLNSEYEFVYRCLVFVKDQKLMKLEGLKLREGEFKLKKSKIQFVKDLLKDIDRSSISLKFSWNQLEADIKQLKEDLKIDENRMESILKSLNSIDGIVKQIKSYGKQFINENFDADYCPLCQAKYERLELVERIIEETNLNNTQSQDFETIHQNISNKKELILEKEKHIEEHRKIIQAFKAVFPEQELKDLNQDLSKLFSFIGQEEQTNDTLREITSIKLYAEELKHTEKEFNELKFSCEQQFKNETLFKYGNSEAFQDLLELIISELDKCNTSIGEIEIERTKIGNDIKKLLGVEGMTLYPKDIGEIFKKQEANILKLKGSFESLQNTIILDNETPTNYLLELSNTLQENISSLREEQKLQFEFENAKKEKEKAKDYISKNSSKLEKYRKALETLRALTGDEASRHVTEFFKDNFLEIFDTFKSIHVPKEFKELKYNNERLELIPIIGKPRTTSQISTGQRSALALSIFLTLNSKLKNGPDIIMFDDPVAFIDDLNALSFLDYLRSRTLKSGKQIFFATANMRLAGLFEKKFGFLKDEFKRFNLERNVDLNSEL